MVHALTTLPSSNTFSERKLKTYSYIQRKRVILSFVHRVFGERKDCVRDGTSLFL